MQTDRRVALVCRSVFAASFLTAAPHALGQPAPLSPCPNDFAEAVGGAGGERLSRFGCVAAPDPEPDGDTAIRVFFRTLYNTEPGDPDGANVCIPRSLSRSPLPSLSQFEGQTRWLGAPYEFIDDAVPLPPNYIGAPLVCTAGEAEIRDWSPAGLQATFGGDALTTRIFFYGYAVVPCSVYEVSQCTDLLDESTCSNPVLIFTSLTGDAWPRFATLGQPNFADINALVEKFKGHPFQPGPTPMGGAPEWHALQKGNAVGNYVLFPTGAVRVGFLDPGVVVEAFKGLPYREDGPCDPDTATDNCGNPCTAP